MVQSYNTYLVNIIWMIHTIDLGCYTYVSHTVLLCLFLDMFCRGLKPSSNSYPNSLFNLQSQTVIIRLFMP